MIGAALGAVLGGALSGGIGAIGASKASKAQQKAAKQARRVYNDAYKANTKTIERGTGWSNNATESAWKTNYQTANALRDIGNGLFAPTAELGGNALQAYASNLGIGTAPEGYSMSLSPATQYQLEQGRETTEGGAAGAGGLYSGATLEALEKMRNGLVAQDFDDQQAQLYNVAGMGQNALSNLYGVNSDWANSIIGGSSDRTDRLIGNASGRTNALTGARNTWAEGTANSYLAQGQAKANGAMNMNNALQGGLQNGAYLFGRMGGFGAY